MAFHVIYRESDGWMWQSYEQATATPLPAGFSQPAGYAIATFTSAPAAGQVWSQATRDFRDPTKAPVVTEDAVVQWIVDQLGGDIHEARRQVDLIAIRKGR